MHKKPYSQITISFHLHPFNQVHNYHGTSVQSLVDASKGAESWRKQNIKVNRACYTCGKEGHRAVDCPQGGNKHGDEDLWAGRGRSEGTTTTTSGESRGGAGIRVGRQQTDGDVLRKFRGKVCSHAPKNEITI